MSTLSAGAAAGLLVALMVASTNDSFGAEFRPAEQPDKGLTLPGETKGFDPQPEPPRNWRAGDGSVMPASR